MTIPSISNSIITVSKVNQAAAQQLFSDRRQNPDEMTCPIWNGMDITGRPVCTDSFVTKMEGCSTAEDRIFVENTLRPHYSSYITTDAAGIAGDGLYDSRRDLIAGSTDSTAVFRSARDKHNPRFGNISTERLDPVYGGAGARQSANGYADQDGDAIKSQNSRTRQAVVIGERGGIKMATHSGDFTVKSVDGSRYVPLSARGTTKYATMASMPGAPRRK